MAAVLVTGAEGFIGSHLVEHLVEQGHSVRALAMYNALGSDGWLEGLACASEIEVLRGDIRDATQCRRMVRDRDVVFNLAALIGIPYSYEAVDSYLSTNVQGTVNLCQASLEAGVGLFVQMSTSEVYGTALTVPIDESHPLQPQSPYSASKVAADAFVRSFHSAFGLPAALARPFNTYGPRQSTRAFIPAVICQLLAGVDSLRVGSLEPTRDLTYVGDTARALSSFIDSVEGLGQAVNIGTNTEISMGAVVHEIQSLLGTSVAIEIDVERVRPAASEVRRLVCDNTELGRLTGSVPTTPLREGLSRTIDWFSLPANRALYAATDYRV